MNGFSKGILLLNTGSGPAFFHWTSVQVKHGSDINASWGADWCPPARALSRACPRRGRYRL